MLPARYWEIKAFSRHLELDTGDSICLGRAAPGMALLAAASDARCRQMTAGRAMAPAQHFTLKSPEHLARHFIS